MSESDSTPKPGTYSLYEPVLEPEEFNRHRLEDANDELDQARNVTAKMTSSFRLALALILASILILIASFFIHGLGENKEPLRAVILFAIGAAAWFLLRRRDLLRGAAFAEVDANSRLLRMEQQAGEAKQVCRAIRNVLLAIWDPIGVKDEIYAQDEYDRYVGDLYELLVGGASEKKLKEYLYWVVRDRMEFEDWQIADMTNTVQALRAIPLA